MARTIRLDVVYPHPPERLWRALTDPRVVSTWLLPTADLAAVVGQRFRFRRSPAPPGEELVYCEVLAADAPRRLSYTWRQAGLETRITWTVSPAPEGARVQLEHAGFSGVKGIGQSVLLGSAWQRRLDRTLPKALAGLAGWGQ